MPRSKGYLRSIQNWHTSYLGYITSDINPKCFFSFNLLTSKHRTNNHNTCLLRIDNLKEKFDRK